MSTAYALQVAIYNKLSTDPAVNAIVGDRIYDGAPPNPVFPYVTFGVSDATNELIDCIPGEEQSLQIDTWHRDNGKSWPCKNLVSAIRKSLDDANFDLSEGALVVLTVERTRVLDDPDTITKHGVVQLLAVTEDAR